MQKLTSRSTCIVAILFGLVSLAGATSALAQAPKNLRVVGVTDWTVTLSWDAPKGKVPASYVVQGSHGHSMTVPGSQTTAVFSRGFDWNRTYSFRVSAISPSGTWSGASNTVTATLPPDVAPPPRPAVSSTGMGPTHVDLAWTYTDPDPSPRFDIYVNEVLWQGQVAGLKLRISFISPDTTYSFTVRARDSGGNWSEVSDPFVVRTPPAANDSEPPTMPPGLWGGVIDGATEAMVFWGNSTDNVTPQDLIRYFGYLNGQFDGATTAPYKRQFSMYLTPGIVNTIEVYAVDEAGNRSAPAKMTIDLR